ncbi:serine-type endopeptidase inhibitor [Tasmannia lanceolata]|uniref:serine-type endopeptidase inhibitor n=1 Tax=Tasmannia lanceolata TaxID=3420 RepID=UPI0040640C37
MASTIRDVSLLFLVVSGMILLGVMPNNMEVKACPQYCLEVDYMTCKSSGAEKLPPKCNCCLASKDCTLHLTDGTVMNCS